MIDTPLKHCGKSQPPNKTNLFPSRDAECLVKEEDYQQLNLLMQKKTDYQFQTILEISEGTNLTKLNQ